MTTTNTSHKTWISKGSMCLQYKWPIVIRKDTVNSLIKSEFIGFPGVIEKAFRLSLETNDKNEVARVCCYINSVELGRLGYKARAATFARKKDFVRLNELEDISESESTVFFRWEKPQHMFELPTGNNILVFRVFLSGVIDEYTLSRFDVLLPEQLWTAAVQNKTTDVNFQVFDSTFSAHKFVLGARSPVFRAMFSTDMAESRTGHVKIVDVEDPDIFEQFLHFLYTGQLSKPASTQLGLLAEKYQVDTLVSLCRKTVPNEKNLKESLLALATTRNVTPVVTGRNVLSPPAQGQPTEADPLHSRSYTLRELDSSIIGKAAQKILDTPYLFKVESTGKNDVYLISFYSWAKESISRVAAVDLEIVTSNRAYPKLVLSRLLSEEAPLQVFSAKIGDFHRIPPNFSLRFIVHGTTLSNAFQYQLRDSLFAQQLWSSAVDKERTDVEFVVGGRAFPAHLAVLTARCPALAALVPAESLSPSSPATVHIPNMDPTAFSSFLSFLYTGSVEEVSFTPSLVDVARTFELDSLRLSDAMDGSHLQLDQDQLSDVLLTLLC